MIAFDEQRWIQVRENWRRWWAKELDRPLIAVQIKRRDPGRPQPAAPLLSQATCTDFSVSADALIDRIDYELSKYIYLGDAFPFVNLDAFGPGVIAAFLGARLDNSSGRVWFHPQEDVDIADLHFTYNPDNPWFARIRDICAAAVRRWQGQVLVGMTDLGGALDILSTFRPSETLLLDLYDHPEEVKRLVWELHELWYRYYQDLNSVLQPVNPGYSDWSGILSETPSYMLQCDFSYMISPEMYKEFSLPELQANCTRLSHSFYHLDGVGQLTHLDQILSIRELDGLQWVPGAGAPTCEHWPEVYQKAHAAGKLIQIMTGGFDTIDAIMGFIGTGKGLFRRIHNPALDEAEIRRQLARYGIE